MKTYSLRIRPQYLPWILDGRKTVEVRVAYPHLTRMQPGDTVRFNDEHKYQVVAVNRYPTFEALLEAEDPSRIAPEIPDPHELMRVLRDIYPPQKEALGVLAIHLTPRQDVSRSGLAGA